MDLTWKARWVKDGHWSPDPTTSAYAGVVSLESVRVGLIYEGKKAPPGWTKTSGHLVFDVKMYFTRKSRWVKDGQWSPDPTTLAYAGVISRESVRVGLTYAAYLNW